MRLHDYLQPCLDTSINKNIKKSFCGPEFPKLDSAWLACRFPAKLWLVQRVFYCEWGNFSPSLPLFLRNAAAHARRGRVENLISVQRHVSASEGFFHKPSKLTSAEEVFERAVRTDAA